MADLEERVSRVEEALGLPGAEGGALASSVDAAEVKAVSAPMLGVEPDRHAVPQLKSKVEALEALVARRDYRINLLLKALDDKDRVIRSLGGTPYHFDVKREA
jgi:hypothetical protein